MDQELVSLYHRHVATALDRQMRLAAFLEQQNASGEPYQFTTSTATLTFGETVRFVAFDIGSHAEPDNSWLWVWCDPSMKLTPANQKLAMNVQKLGRKTGISALNADRQVSCDELLGDDLSPIAAHVFALIVMGELGFDAYYTMPFPNGRFATVITDERLRAAPSNPSARILSVFPQVLSDFPVFDHRAAFNSYVESYGLTAESREETVRVLDAGVETLEATFDGSNRMINLTGSFG